MNVDNIEIVGAVYGAVQALAQAFMLILPKNTIAFKIFKWLVSGPAREVPPVGGV